MGVTFEYFTARDDHAAAALADSGPAAGGAPTATAGGIADPTAHLAPVVALLLRRPEAEVGPTFEEPVAVRDDGERLVLPITPVVSAAFATVDDDRVPDVAAAWSRSSAFWRAPDPALLTTFVHALAALTRRGDRLYCWMSV